MADLAHSLLSLPVTSNGFTALRFDPVDQGSSAHPHPHKTPRLDADSDSGSASRARGRVKGKDKDEPRIVQIHGFIADALVEKAYSNAVATVKHSLRVLLTKDTKELLIPSIEGVYDSCRTAVEGGWGASLYDGLVAELRRCCSDLHRELTCARPELEPIEWLDRFVRVCAWFEGQMAFLRSILAYLDRAYVLGDPKLCNIHDLGFKYFKAKVLDDCVLIEQIRLCVCDWLVWERNSGTIHPQRAVIPQLVSHLTTHGVYNVIFERFVVEHALAYYTEEADRLVGQANIDPEAFLAHVTGRVAEEKARAEDIYHPSTVLPVQDAVRRGLLQARLEWLAGGVVAPLMNARETRQLSLAYTEFAAAEGLDILCKEFKAHVQHAVTGIIRDTENDDSMVDRLLEFKSFSDRTLQAAFTDPKTQQPDQDFSYALTDAFALGFKTRRNKPAELIAKHLDRLMRRGQRELSDAAFDALLDSVLGLYRYTDDKDVFRTFYHRALARRLLLERSASDDFEKTVLKKLKEGYDPEFGMGDRMFNDLALSRDVLREYHARLSAHSAGHQLSVMVLQRSVWPFAARKFDVDLPPWMQSQLDGFVSFYKSKHPARRLDWDHALGTATLRAWFPGAAKDLTVSLYQAVVLLLFNESSELGYGQILEATRMDPEELKRTLQSLACANKKVLRKRPPGRDVGETDVFAFNADFTDPRPRVHINSIQAKETPEESRRTQSHVDSDRKHYLDAAIVRITKAKKELTYEQLKTQTIAAVRDHFVPDVSMIKQRIAALVEQEYLRRDEEDMNRYIYVA